MTQNIGKSNSGKRKILRNESHQSIWVNSKILLSPNPNLQDSLIVAKKAQNDPPKEKNQKVRKQKNIKQAGAELGQAQNYTFTGGGGWLGG